MTSEQIRAYLDERIRRWRAIACDRDDPRQKTARHHLDELQDLRVTFYGARLR